MPAAGEIVLATTPAPLTGQRRTTNEVYAGCGRGLLQPGCWKDYSPLQCSCTLGFMGLMIECSLRVGAAGGGCPAALSMPAFDTNAVVCVTSTADASLMQFIEWTTMFSPVQACNADRQCVESALPWQTSVGHSGASVCCWPGCYEDGLKAIAKGQQ